MLRNLFQKSLLAVLLVFFLVFSVNSFLAQGGDFEVFWNAGLNYITGQPIYDLARDGGTCYKYPPWITPLFLPFSIFPLRVAGVLWRLFQLGCLFYSLQWCKERCRSFASILFIFFNFWGIWMNNVLTGQISILLLALALFGFSLAEKKIENYGLDFFSIFISLSAKVFTLVSFFGVPMRIFSFRKILVLILWIGLASVPALWGYSWHLDRLLAASSETMLSVGGKIGGGHYGLPSLWVSLFSFDPENHRSHLIGFIISLVTVGCFYFWIRQHLSKSVDRFVTALALGLAIHPLAFSYTFAMGFPLAVFTLDRAMKFNYFMRALTFFGVAGVSFLPLTDHIPFKALSVILLSGLLAFMQRLPSGSLGAAQDLHQ